MSPARRTRTTSTARRSWAVLPVSALALAASAVLVWLAPALAAGAAPTQVSTGVRTAHPDAAHIVARGAVVRASTVVPVEPGPAMAGIEARSIVLTGLGLVLGGGVLVLLAAGTGRRDR